MRVDVAIRGLATAVLFAAGFSSACGSPPHDPVVAGHQQAAEDQSVPLAIEDLSSSDMADPIADLSLGDPAKLVTGGGPPVLRLARGTVGDLLYACTVAAIGPGLGAKIVSISKTTGVQATVLPEDTTATISGLEVDANHVYWGQRASGGGKAVLRMAYFSGAPPATIFDPAQGGAIPAGHDLAQFYVSTVDGQIYIVTADASSAQVGRVPVGGGTYAKIAVLSYAGQTAVGFTTAHTLTMLLGVVYVGGYITVGSIHQAVLFKVPQDNSAVTTPWTYGAAGAIIRALSQDGARLYWTDGLGSLYGYDPGANNTGRIGGVPSNCNALVTTSAYHYCASTIGNPNGISITRMVKATGSWNGTGTSAAVTQEPAFVTDLGCAALTPTLAVDDTQLYFNTNDSIYRLPLL